MNWSTTPPTNWDEHLFAGNGHFLQSSHWAAFNEAQGKKVFFAQGTDWQCLAILEPGRVARLYCPYGPLAKSKKSLEAALATLKKLARQQNAVFVRLEPIAPLRKPSLKELGLRHALKNIQPPQTWVKDLTKSEEELIAEMTATNRNLYRTAANKGLTFRASHKPADMQIFLDMIHDVAQHTGMQPHHDDYYQTMASTLLPRKAATLYIAEHHGKPVASAFVFDSPTTRYYAHAGSFTETRKLHPGSPLLTKMILDAKKNGQTQFDFVGIAPPNSPNHPWAGFTKFKQSFGGEYKPYLGTWELPVKPLAYTVYRGAYHLSKKLRSR